MKSMASPLDPLTPAALQALRSQFPILGSHTYLNSCSLGALSKEAEARLADFTDLWHTMGASAWYEHWMGRLEELRRAAGDFVGAPAGSVALEPSTSVALAVLAESLDWSHRRKVITTELDFPTLLYQWSVRPDVELVILESHDGISVPVERFAAAVDEHTQLIATSHVNFTTGAIQEIDAIADVAHEAGALCLIDGYQGAGQVPLDLSTTNVDFYTWGPLKWLCGGPGLAYLYVRPDRIPELEPRITSWFATKDQFQFRPGEFRYHDDARRFEMGTPALPTVHTALGGQAIMSELGAPAIVARNRVLTEYLLDRCQSSKLATVVAPEPSDRSAIVLLPHSEPARVVAALADQGIIVDHRPGKVRVSPHVYTTNEEIDRFVEAMVAIG